LEGSLGQRSLDLGAEGCPGEGQRLKGDRLLAVLAATRFPWWVQDGGRVVAARAFVPELTLLAAAMVRAGTGLPAHGSVEEPGVHDMARNDSLDQDNKRPDGEQGSHPTDTSYIEKDNTPGAFTGGRESGVDSIDLIEVVRSGRRREPCLEPKG
jgi:hypothetical protein